MDENETETKQAEPTAEELRTLEIHGVPVVFRGPMDFPAEGYYDLPRKMAAVAKGGEPHLEKAPEFLVMVVDTWGFPLDPRDPKSYGKTLGIFELMGLTNAAAAYVAALQREVSKISPK